MCVLEVKLLDNCSLLLRELFKLSEHLILFNQFKIAQANGRSRSYCGILLAIRSSPVFLESNMLLCR